MTCDAAWLFAHDRTYFDEFGQRFDVAGAVRWSNPAYPGLRDGNHAAFGPAEAAIPEQIERIIDAQRQDGAVPCIDTYGERGSADALCAEYGFRRETPVPVQLWVVERAWVRQAAETMRADSAPVEAIPAESWAEVCCGLHLARAPSPAWDAALIAAAARNATFHGIRIGDRWVACIATWDEGDAVRVNALRVDPEFQRTGFARAMAVHALAAAGPGVGFFLAAADNPALAAVAATTGARVCCTDVRRRYILDR
jgi:GNAT superfamily N-acetyltransferase